MDVVTASYSSPWRKGQDTNSTAGSFSAQVDILTEPVGSATRTVLNFAPGPRPSKLYVKPYGGSEDNETINVKVVGLSRILPAPQETGVNNVVAWNKSTICEIACTLSSALTGVAGGPVAATEFYADSLVTTKGVATLHNGTVDIDQAWFEVDISMFERVEIEGDLGTADTMNWLWAV